MYLPLRLDVKTLPKCVPCCVLVIALATRGAFLGAWIEYTGDLFAAAGTCACVLALNISLALFIHAFEQVFFS